VSETLFSCDFQGLLRSMMESMLLKALTTLLSFLAASCLFERRVCRICLVHLRFICLVNWNATRGAAGTSVLALGFFVCIVNAAGGQKCSVDMAPIASWTAA